MCATFLLTWNPGKSDWDNFQEDWTAVSTGNRPIFRWSCGNTKKIIVGDRVFLMRLGWRERVTGLVASGWVMEPPFYDQHWNREHENRTTLYIGFEPDILFNPDLDELFDPTPISENFSWRPQNSGITIPEEIASVLESAWQQHVFGHNFQIAGSNVQPGKTRTTYFEGGRKTITSYRYERDPRARDACIAHYGTNCVVCGFDFGQTFGPEGEGFIHVHHLRPMSESPTTYEVDPIKDLRPVCPNCHTMLHRRDPPYSTEDLKRMRK